MIDALAIQNFKCIRSASIKLEPLTVFIGPNDSGKSSALQCLRLAGMLGSIHVNDNAKNAAAVLQSNMWRFSSELLGSVEVKGSFPDPFELKITSSVKTFDQYFKIGNDCISVSSQSPNKEKARFRDVVVSANPNLSLLGQLIASKQGWDDISNVAAEIRTSGPLRLSVTEMRKPSEAIRGATLEENGANLAAVISELMTGPDRQAIINLERSLSDAIPSLRGVTTPPNPKQLAQRELRFALDGPESPPVTISAQSVSDGALYFTAFLSLLTSESSGILLIEEPENGLHPARLRGVVELLRKLTSGIPSGQRKQVILTTHSPVLLNAVEPLEVQVFHRSREDQSTEVTCMANMPNIEQLKKDFSTGELWYLFGEDVISGASKE